MSFKEKFNRFFNKLGGEEIKVQDKTNKCPHCGASLNPDFDYCEYCKTKQEKEENNLSNKLKNFASKIFVSSEELKQSFEEDKDW